MLNICCQYKHSCMTTEKGNRDTTTVPSSLRSSVQLPQQIRLCAEKFMPELKLTMRRFCIIPKTGRATPTVSYVTSVHIEQTDRFLLISSKQLKSKIKRTSTQYLFQLLSGSKSNQMSRRQTRPSKMSNFVQGTPKKSNPLGKIRYLWNYRRFFHQIYSVYRWGFRPHILQILLK